MVWIAHRPTEKMLFSDWKKVANWIFGGFFNLRTSKKTPCKCMKSSVRAHFIAISTVLTIFNFWNLVRIAHINTEKLLFTDWRNIENWIFTGFSKRKKLFKNTLYIACSENGAHYELNDLEDGEHIEDSPETCQIRCQNVVGCKFWSYVTYNRTCNLKHNKILIKKEERWGRKRYTNDVISGPKSCSE